MTLESGARSMMERDGVVSDLAYGGTREPSLHSDPGS